MFDTYINEKLSEKRDYDIYLIIEYLIIYLKSLFVFIDEKDSRKRLTEYIKKYLKYTKKEFELLIRIRELNCKLENDKDVIGILDKLEQLFVLNYKEIESIMLGYEDSFKYNCILYSNFKDKGFDIKYLDDSIERIKGMEI